MNIFLRFSTILCLFASYTTLFAAPDNNAFRLKTIVIDAGHGGNDGGCAYGGVLEKNVTLAIATKLATKMKQQHPDLTVVCTRSTDKFVGLAERGIIANRAQGDLFISIHINAQRSGSTANGAEVYTLGLHKSAQSLEVAKRENNVITLESDYEVRYEGFNPNDAESYIMFGLGQYAYSRESISFASLVQKQLVDYCSFSDRSVRQAGYLVLWRASMPSILVEAGFLSNPDNRRYLSSEKGVTEITQAILTAFNQYRRTAEGTVEKVAKTAPSRSQQQDEPKPQPTEASEDTLFFTVQISSSPSSKKITAALFGKRYNEVFEQPVGSNFKYCIGRCDSYKDALSLQQTLRQSGYKDAFVIAFEHGERVDLNKVKNR